MDKTENSPGLFAKLLDGALGGDVRPGEGRWLLTPKGHWTLMASRRAALMAKRTRVVCLFLSVAVLLWLPFDVLMFDGWRLWVLVFSRISASMAFAFCASRAGGLSREKAPEPSLALRLALAAGLTSMLLHFGAAVATTGHIPPSGTLSESVWPVLSRAYAYMPIVMAASTALFPLTVLEGLGGTLLAVFALLAGAAISPPDFEHLAGDLWLVGLVSAVSLFSSASQLSFMIEMARSAFRDPLTGAFGRRSAEELLDLHFMLSVRTSQPLCIAFVDLDHFKSINDAFGHDAGDSALKNACEVLREGFRQTDIVARWGGEEFVAVLPNATVEQALIAMDRFIHSGLGSRPDGAPLTASIGVAERKRDSADNWHDLVAVSDRRMYAAKRAGRNRVDCDS